MSRSAMLSMDFFRLGRVRSASTLFACVTILTAIPAEAAHVADPAVPRRIVSLDLCADQYLLALADRSQIAGLTHNADSPELSAAANQTAGLPILGQSAEEILEIKPDLLIGLPVRRTAVIGALRGRHYKMLDLPSAESFAGIAKLVRRIAAAVGHPERGAALVAGMERELASLPRPGHGRVAAYYQRRGFLTGTGTLIDDLMQRVGLVNLAGKLGKPPLSRLSLEELVAAQPDFLIVDARNITDQGTEMLQHPALRGIPRIIVPQAWTVCGGPAYVSAARSMARQLAAH